MDIEKLAQQFEAQHSKTEYPKEEITESATSDELPAVELTENENADIQSVAENTESEKKDGEESKLADDLRKVEEERENLRVQKEQADNKIRKQEIKNDLIVLKAKAIRLKREQRQLIKEQKIDHKVRSKEARWQLHKDSLTQMKYTYVPNLIVLYVLLFINGVTGFFKGLRAVNPTLLKVIRWVAVIGIILAILFSIPSTNQWLRNLF